MILNDNKQFYVEELKELFFTENKLNVKIKEELSRQKYNDLYFGFWKHKDKKIITVEHNNKKIEYSNYEK